MAVIKANKGQKKNGFEIFGSGERSLNQGWREAVPPAEEEHHGAAIWLLAADEAGAQKT